MSAISALAGFEGRLERDPGIIVQELEQFSQLVFKWQDVQNLVSRETLPFFWTRHVRDSLQLLKYVDGAEQVFLDLGSGAGFPAIPLAIALKTSEASFILVEANKRKAAFLRMVVRELGLDAKIHGTRLEKLSPKDLKPVDIVTSRATAPLDDLFRLVSPFWRKDTLGLFHKGKNSGEELVKTAADWRCDVVEWTSETDVGGKILEVRNLAEIS